MGKGILEFTDDNFKKEVLESNIPVLVDFGAAWCGPCKAIAPAIEELGQELDSKLKIGKLNVDENPDVVGKFNILNIPTLIFFKGGGEMGRMVGINSKAEILKKIKEYFD